MLWLLNGCLLHRVLPLCNLHGVLYQLVGACHQPRCHCHGAGCLHGFQEGVDVLRQRHGLVGECLRFHAFDLGRPLVEFQPDHALLDLLRLLGRLRLLLMLNRLLLLLLRREILVESLLPGDLPDSRQQLFLPRETVVQVHVDIEHGDTGIVSLAAPGLDQGGDQVSQSGHVRLPHGLAVVRLGQFVVRLRPGDAVDRVSFLVHGVDVDEIMFLRLAGDPDLLLGVQKLLDVGHFDLAGQLQPKKIIGEQAIVSGGSLVLQFLDRYA